MAYTTSQAVEALNEYMGCDEALKQYIEGTKERGFVLSLKTGEQIVIFVYPLVHKQDNTKNYFDTRDSGAYERGVAWRYALEHGLKYYCFGLNSSVDKYENYIFSLECGEETIEKISGTKNGQRSGPGNQIIIPNNYTPTLPFDRIVNKLGIYIAVIHKDKIYDYISMYDNRPYLKISTDEVSQQNGDVNEYEKAARYLQSYVSETGLDISTKKEDLETILAEFTSKFSPEILASLPDEELLNYLFYTVGENQDSLCCWLEMNKDCRQHFGSISGGSAYKFGLFQKQKTGEWTTGSPQKPQVVTEDEALELGRNIRDALVKAAGIVQNATLDSLAGYEQLDTTLWNEVGEPYCNWGWFHKYLAMVCPDKLSCFHSSDWQRHILYALKIKPSDKYFTRSGQLAMISNYAGWYYGEFKDVLFERFGGDIIQFVRVGTSDDTQNYAAEWNQKSVVGIGWRDIGSLEDYVAGEGLDKGAITEALKEKFGYAENVASRKAGELIRFYKTDSSTVVVAMDGESLLAFVDGIGNYFYDPTSAMANMKPGTWHRNFASGEHLPVKSEGKLTSCYPLTDEENLMFLYDRYYYGNEEIIDEVDEIEFDNPEERNKRNFRAWMETQVKPEGDSDAGQPYTANSINQYVSNISNTPLPSHEGRSVFYTDAVIEVQDCLVVLESSEKKNNTQKSAVKKYLMYLMALQEVNMPLIYNTDLPTKYERNRIVFGAPGTGKSFNLKRDCEACLKDTEGSYERVTFHPDYTYSQFVGTYKPVSDGTAIRYEFVPGPFMRVYVEAMKSARSLNPQPHILIIEEINRAKVAAVFGDVFQLLDRDEDGVSELCVYICWCHYHRQSCNQGLSEIYSF